MLSSLMLNNVALFKKQNIDFQNGFNCLLGQSGAGKSIIIDALSFSLGAKADKNLIRSGQQTMRVDAVFSSLSKEELKFLEEQDIEVEDELIVTRTLSADGKSTIKMNGFPVTAKTLKDFACMTADFCGQHDSVGLLNVNNHLALLDKFAGAEVESLKVQISAVYDDIKDLDRKIAELGGSDEQRERTKEILEYQIQEIEDAKLSVGEYEELKERFDFISSAENIFEKVGNALGKLDKERENVTMLLYEAKQELSSLSNFKNIDECRERIENAYYEIKDVAEVLDEIRQNTEYDPKELERIDERLETIKKLSKKYGKDIESILNYLSKCQNQLEELENGQFLLEKLSKERSEKECKILNLCENLSQVRRQYAQILEKQLTLQLEDLQMSGTYFKVEFERVGYTKNGFDAVKFMFSANKGQDVKDLHKTASGGELSRLLLAFKNVLLEKEKVQTVVFDEIDSGISGHIAGKVAEKLANISKFTQVICITHTPMVASKADSFLLVEKSVVGEETVSTARNLEESEAIVEVAKLIDGAKEVSSTAIEHAKKLFQ